MSKKPFYIGQPADHVLVVAKRTGRKLTEPPRILNREELAGEGDDPGLLAVAERGIVQWKYSDVALTFRRGHGPKGEGAECFRIIEIEWRGADG